MAAIGKRSKVVGIESGKDTKYGRAELLAICTHRNSSCDSAVNFDHIVIPPRGAEKKDVKAKGGKDALSSGMRVHCGSEAVSVELVEKGGGKGILGKYERGVNLPERKTQWHCSHYQALQRRWANRGEEVCDADRSLMASLFLLKKMRSPFVLRFAAMATLLQLWAASFPGAQARYARSLLADAPSVTIKTVKMEGSGCAAGTVEYVMSPEASTIDFFFPSFQAGESSTTSECILTVEMDYPTTRSFSVAQLYYRGYLQVGQNDWARLYGSYKHQPGQPHCFGEDSWERATSGEDIDYGLNCGEASPCGEIKPIIVHSTLSTSKPEARLKVESVLVRIDWADC
ncbi:hypothetical protein CBR_g42113 [Chara braunii]|uniref:Uncharacterized protein n=1 Tax=Chara braunii TaxID=69332 RepID=A0A388LWX8_CHABU|nr:hypothetical protein CBR_g42113 [Chara braunii]|eukprot:GBG86830.1 hypothetical protein CBR_g42113 [Chara braunii]